MSADTYCLNKDQAKLVANASSIDMWKHLIVEADAGTGKTVASAALINTLRGDASCAAITCCPTAVGAAEQPDGFIPCKHKTAMRPLPACTVARLLTPGAQTTIWDCLRDLAHQRKLALLHILLDEYAMLNGVDFDKLLTCARDALRGTVAKFRFVMLGDTKQLAAVDSSILSTGAFASVLTTAACYTLSETMRWSAADADYTRLHKALVDKNAHVVGLMLRELWVTPVRGCPTHGVTNTVYLAYANKVVDAINERAVDNIACAQRRVYLLVAPKTSTVTRRLVQTGSVLGLQNRPKPDKQHGYIFANKQVGTLINVTGDSTACEDAVRYGAGQRIQCLLLNKNLTALVECADGAIVELPAIREKTDTGITYSLHLQHSYGRNTYAVQGQTIDRATKCVLDLNGLPDWHALYVMLTRCRQFSQMIILPWDDSDGLDRLLHTSMPRGLDKFRRAFAHALAPPPVN